MIRGTSLLETPRYYPTYPITFRYSRLHWTVRDRQLQLFSPLEFFLTSPIAMESIDSFAKDGQRLEQPVQRRSIGLRARTILRWPGNGRRFRASRSWGLSTISLLCTRQAGSRCARFGLEQGRISKSWRAWPSDEPASLRSSGIEASKIICNPVILCWWQQMQTNWRRTVSV